MHNPGQQHLTAQVRATKRSWDYVITTSFIHWVLCCLGEWVGGRREGPLRPAGAHRMRPEPPALHALQECPVYQLGVKRKRLDYAGSESTTYMS